MLRSRRRRAGLRARPNRHRAWLGPIYWNYYLWPVWRPRVSSWGVHLWLWTKNFTTGESTFNIPGLLHWTWGRYRR